jgi:hypothetical protein
MGKEYYGPGLTAAQLGPGAIADGTNVLGRGVNFFWVPDSPPSSATAPPSQPSPTPVHLQFSANTIGTPAPLIWGRCRTAGQIIWAAGIDAENSVIDTSYLTFAASYGEPVDPGRASGYSGCGRTARCSTAAAAPCR